MFGIENEVTVRRTTQGIEFSLGSKPEIKIFDSEAEAERGIGRERVLWSAAFVICTGLTIHGLSTIGTQVSHFPNGIEMGEIIRGLVEMFVGGIAVRSTWGKVEQRNQAMNYMHNYHFP